MLTVYNKMYGLGNHCRNDEMTTEIVRNVRFARINPSQMCYDIPIPHNERTLCPDHIFSFYLSLSSS